MADAWILAHGAATLAMVGFMWTIQLVHYPLIAAVPAEARPAYVAGHQRRVVATLLLFAPAEVVTAASLAFVEHDLPAWLWFGSGTVLAALWVGTGAWFAQLHGRLADGGDVVDLLVRTNWLRTVGWSLRGVAAVAMLAIELG